MNRPEPEVYQATSGFSKVGALDIHLNAKGDGPPLLMLHGGGAGVSGWQNYHANFEHFAQRYRVIVPDFPCFGRSSTFELEEGRIELFARTMVGLLDALGIASAHIVGNSLGGAVALQMALTDPARVGKLVLMGPAIGMTLSTPVPTEGMKHMGGYYAGDGPSETKMRAMCETMVFDKSIVTGDMVRSRYEQSIAPDILKHPLGAPTAKSPFTPLWPRLSEIRHETLVIWGKEDRVLPMDAAYVMLALMPKAQIHIFPACGHWVQLEKREAFNRLCDAFLDPEG